MGITSVINNQLHPNTEILILEMGAFRKGEIKEMTKFVPLNIAGITDQIMLARIDASSAKVKTQKSGIFPTQKYNIKYAAIQPTRV